MEFIIEMRVPVTADDEPDAEARADALCDKFEEITGRDVYLDNVRPVTAGD